MEKTFLNVFVDMEWSLSEKSEGSPLSIALMTDIEDSVIYGEFQIPEIVSTWTQHHVLPQLQGLPVQPVLDAIQQYKRDKVRWWATEPAVKQWLASNHEIESNLLPSTEKARQTIWWLTQEWLDAHNNYNSFTDVQLLKKQWRAIFK